MNIIQVAKVDYNHLNARQKETRNFHKIASELSEFGFNSLWLTDDWQGADFISIHKDGEIIKVQLKGRFTVDAKYLGKELYIAFFDNVLGWFLYPHDQLHTITMNHSLGANKNGARSIGGVPKWLYPHLEIYIINKNNEYLNLLSLKKQ